MAGPKIYSWEDEIQKTLNDFAAPWKKFPSENAARLIDYLASHTVVPRDDFLGHAAAINGGDAENFLATNLASVTMSVHGGGSVPDPGGWYFHDKDMNVYVMDRWFSAQWKNARGL